MNTVIEGTGIQRRVPVGGCMAICNITHSDNIEHWSCFDGGRVAEVLVANGMYIVGISSKQVDVDRSVYYFRDERYTLNQCDDIFNWISQSKEGEFTYHYDRVVFHTKGRKFYAAYRNDINNFVEV